MTLKELYDKHGVGALLKSTNHIHIIQGLKSNGDVILENTITGNVVAFAPNRLDLSHYVKPVVIKTQRWVNPSTGHLRNGINQPSTLYKKVTKVTRLLNGALEVEYEE